MILRPSPFISVPTEPVVRDFDLNSPRKVGAGRTALRHFRAQGELLPSAWAEAELSREPA